MLTFLAALTQTTSPGSRSPASASSLLRLARLADFTSAFGNDLPMLSVQIQRYVDALP